MGEPINLKVTVSKGSGFYVRAARNFLEGNKEKDAVDSITISGLGNAINSAALVASRLEKDGIGTVTKVVTAYPEMTAGKSDRGVAQLVITMEKGGGGGGGGDVEYDPTPEKLTSNKNFEKKNKKVTKEGGKRGVEIEGAADMGGLQFFCTSVVEPAGDPDWLYESLKAMNAKSDPTEEERKGGSGHVGKMLVSIDETKCIALVSYVPKKHLATIQADTWLKDILKGLGAGAPENFLSGNSTTAKALIENSSDKGLFALKLKDDAIGQSIAYLKKKGLFPDHDDDDDDYVFGDDDFPS